MAEKKLIKVMKKAKTFCRHLFRNKHPIEDDVEDAVIISEKPNSEDERIGFVSVLFLGISDRTNTSDWQSSKTTDCSVCFFMGGGKKDELPTETKHDYSFMTVGEIENDNERKYERLLSQITQILNVSSFSTTPSGDGLIIIPKEQSETAMNIFHLLGYNPTNGNLMLMPSTTAESNKLLAPELNEPLIKDELKKHSLRFKYFMRQVYLVFKCYKWGKEDGDIELNDFVDWINSFYQFSDGTPLKVSSLQGAERDGWDDVIKFKQEIIDTFIGDVIEDNNYWKFEKELCWTRPDKQIFRKRRKKL